MPDDFIREDEDIVSRHFLRRMARLSERDLTREGKRVRVVKARRGPHRWYVVKVNG